MPKPETRVLFHGHGFVLYAYPIRNPVTREYEWAHCVARQVKPEAPAEDFQRFLKYLTDRNYYHTLQSASRDLATRLAKKLSTAQLRAAMITISDTVPLNA
jgi:acyl carrier protein phosphodiesterase